MKKSITTVFAIGLAIGLAACFILIQGCGRRSNVTVVKPPSQVAREGLACLEKYDSPCISQFLWDREASKTGLTPEAVAAVVSGPFKEATNGFAPEGEPKLNTMDTNSVEIQRTYRTPDGKRHGLALIATGGQDGGRLAPLSMELFIAMGNADQNPGEYHISAWRRVLKRNKAMFESVGWHGMFGSSSFTEYRTWDQLDSHFAAVEQQHFARLSKPMVGGKR